MEELPQLLPAAISIISTESQEPMQHTVLIVGAGQAAAQAAISLRHDGHEGRIMMIGEETYLPYQRPPLSKTFLSGQTAMERLQLRPPRFYSRNRIELRLGAAVTAIDPRQHTATFRGEAIHYDKLILATGSKVRRLPIPGQDLAQVHHLRTIDDVRAIKAGFHRGQRLVVIGGGYIGLEVAAVARSAGLEVTVMEIADRVMARAVAPVISDFYLQVHRQAGVRINLQTGVRAIRRTNRELRLSCSNGAEIAADMVIIGVGILPATELAEDAGLGCDNGIIVDEYCRTSHPDIYAVGDCSNHPNELLNRRLRLESVHNALEQGKTAALHIVGKPTPYAQIPWFWSDQYDLKLQMTGIAENHTVMAVRGEPSSRHFAVFYFRNRRLIAVHAVNSPREFMLSRRLVNIGAEIDPGAVADPDIDFRDIAKAALTD